MIICTHDNEEEEKGYDKFYIIYNFISDVLLSNADLPGIPYGWGVRLCTLPPRNNAMLMHKPFAREPHMRSRFFV